ncbi:Cubilin [Holothuria leucospilota]|uniref:Cubilin n=1 Tax=Holothuria leucospilota TaxID=206669 RepID=A0A9Q0YP93_HOLLE|nr:Cubilin [Holothuria leucospilota]
MESGEILNSQLTHPNFCHQPEGFRLFRTGEIWIGTADTSIHTKSQTVGIDLIHQHVVTAIATQGVHFGLYASYFKLFYERQHASDTWNTYLNTDGSEKIFEANFDHFSVVINHLERPIVTSKIRLEYGYMDEKGPGTTCLRMEVFGCNYTDSGNVCGSRGKEIMGRCFGVVEGNAPSACQYIFQENSFTAIVNSENLQNAIRESFQDLQLPNYLFYRIGATNVWVQETGEQRFIWGDGTPVIYDNFLNTNVLDGQGNATHCAFMMGGNSLQWQILECNTPEINAATLCQFDLNECLAWNNGCSDECIDLPGSYVCTCPSGKYLDETTRENCISTCNLRGSDDIAYDDDLCLNSNSVGESWTDAMGICSHQNASLLSYTTSSVHPELIPTNSSTQGMWIANTGTGSVGGLCPTYTAANSTIHRECHLKLPFYCEKDVPKTFELLSACETNTHERVNHCEMEVVYYNEAYLTWYGLPPWYQEETTLRFHLIVATDLRIRFTFVYVNLRQLTQTHCTDSVKIVQNFASTESTRGIYCGILQDFEVQLDSHNVTITLDIGKLSADMPKALEMHAFFRGLNCSNENCGTTCPTQPFTDSQGFIQTYQYPALLPQFYSCVWDIIVTPGSAIYLEIIDIDIPCDPRFPLVVEDFQTSDDVMSRRSEICGRNVGMMVSEGYHVTLILRTGLQRVSSGFKAKYVETDTPGCGLSHSSEEGCSENTCTAPSAFIASKNYPLPYENNLDCSWTIKTSEGTFIEVNFAVFNVSSTNEDCEQDYLQIRSGSSSVKLCNANINRYHWVYKSNKNELVMRLKTNSDNFAGALLAHYQETHFPFISPNKTSVCNGTKINDRCFRLFRNPLKLHWLEASEICKSLSNTTFLAAINNQVEMNAIHQYLLEVGDPTKGVYIGLRLHENTKRHVWESGYPVSFTDWRVAGEYSQRQPDGGELESCSVIQFWSYRETSNWNDIPCAALVTDQFLCQEDVSVDVNEAAPALTFFEGGHHSFVYCFIYLATPCRVTGNRVENLIR